MTKIVNNEQYEWAVARVEQLLPLVDEAAIFCRRSVRTEPIPWGVNSGRWHCRWLL